MTADRETKASPTTRYGVSRQELARIIEDQPSFRVNQIWRGLYTELKDPAELTTLPKDLRSRLTDALPFALTLVNEVTSDAGDTVKFLWQLADGSRIETVLMLYAERA
ncbi:MAG: 23S rRNA (adenine(2503)-C(2))-methyltransferase RlmN, partial [Ilumatobacteraceae bacterium]